MSAGAIWTGRTRPWSVPAESGAVPRSDGRDGAAA
jgi:hypothetical protein